MAQSGGRHLVCICLSSNFLVRPCIFKRWRRPCRSHAYVMSSCRATVCWRSSRGNRDHRPQPTAHRPPPIIIMFYFRFLRLSAPPSGGCHHHPAGMRRQLDSRFSPIAACNDHVVCIACTLKLNGGHRKSSNKSGARTQRNKFTAQFNIPTLSALISYWTKSLKRFKYF